MFTEALGSARVRPVHAAYPQISQALGEAILSVLLGKDSPMRRPAPVRGTVRRRPAHPPLTRPGIREPPASTDAFPALSAFPAFPAFRRPCPGDSQVTSR